MRCFSVTGSKGAKTFPSLLGEDGRMDVGSFPVFPSEGRKMISGAAKVWKVGLDASHEDWPGRKHPCCAPYLSEPIRSSMFPAQFVSCLLGCCQWTDVPVCRLFVESRCHLEKVCCRGWRCPGAPWNWPSESPWSQRWCLGRC